MCIYDRNAFGCGHQEWGPMKAQCTRYWQKCCIRTSHESFTHSVPGLCHSCQTRCPDEHNIAKEDSLHLTIRLKPSMALESTALDATKGRPTLANPENVKSYITDCLKRYQRAHNLPEDSIKVSDANCAPTPRKPTAIDDLYHIQTCGPCNSDCKKLQDYEMQLMLLERQNKRRLMMARNETEHANDARTQPITTSSYQEIKFRNHQLQDYQKQLMREALAAIKKEEPSACTKGEADAQLKSEPQDPFNEEGMKNLFLEDYRKQVKMYQSCGNSKNTSTPHPNASKYPADVIMWSNCRSGDTNEQVLQEQKALREDQDTRHRLLPTPMRAPFQAATQAPDASHSNDRATSARQSQSCIQDYEMQLRLLEQQNKKRLFMARNEQDGTIRRSAMKLQDSELETARTPAQAQAEAQAKAQAQAQAQAQASNHALQDYQMQLMLLEQQRKRVPMHKTNWQQKAPVRAPSDDQESEQIMEMGSAMRLQKTFQHESDLSAPIPANSSPRGQYDMHGVMWRVFKFENRGVETEYTIRCDVNSVNCDKLSPGFKTENCLSHTANDHVKGCDGDKTERNNLGWALADLNPPLRNNLSLLRQAVDCCNGMSFYKVVKPPREDEEDTTMWSTDECEEWSNCGDEMETVEKDDV